MTRQKNAVDILDDLGRILPDRPVTVPREFNTTVAKLEASGLCNLVCPTTHIDMIPQFQAVSFRLVSLTPHDFYKPKWAGRDEERRTHALKGEAIQRLANEAGVRPYPPSERIDDRSDPHYCHVRGYATVRGMHGREITISKDRELDLRPGAPEAQAMTDRQLPRARQTILRVCETKAQLRAMRAVLGLKQAYTEDQARLPFVLTALVANLDLSNPVHANLAAAHALGDGVVQQLYGKPPRQQALPEGVDRKTGEVIDAEPVSRVESYEIPPPDDEPAAAVRCSCPCGCGHELDTEAAERSRATIETERCRRCWPSPKTWDLDKHRGLNDDDDLKIPVRPDLTAGKLRKLAREKESA